MSDQEPLAIRSRSEARRILAMTEEPAVEHWRLRAEKAEALAKEIGEKGNALGAQLMAQEMLTKQAKEERDALRAELAGVREGALAPLRQCVAAFDTLRADGFAKGPLPGEYDTAEENARAALAAMTPPASAGDGRGGARSPKGGPQAG